MATSPDGLIQQAQQAARTAQTASDAKIQTANLSSANQVAMGVTAKGFGVVDTVGQAPGSQANQAFDWNIFENIITPPPFSPTVDISTTYLADYNTELAALEAWIRNIMSGWLSTYFPTLNPALITAEDSWLLNVVNNGYSGIPVALETAIWERARGKEMVEAVRLEEEAVAQFASRGFSIPPGALANRVLQVQQDATNKSSTIARDLAIKQIENAIEMTKLAITEITKLRLGIAAALADFFRASMALPQAAADIAKTKASLHQVLWNSSADYMRAQVSIAELDLKAKMSNQSTALAASELNAKLIDSTYSRTVNAAISSAELYAREAAAALGSQNTLVGSIETTARTIAAA